MATCVSGRLRFVGVAVAVGIVAAAGAASAGSVAMSGSTVRGNGQIAFDRPDPNSQGDTFVYVANPDGSHMRRLTGHHGCCPSWSHSGLRLTLSGGAANRIVPATVGVNGRGYKLLTVSNPRLSAGCPVWSPDDSRLACETWNDTDASVNGVYTLSSADGGDLTRLTSNPIGGHDEPGGYSPDGKQLVFGRFDDNGNGTGLFIVNADGSGLRQLTPKGTILQDGNTGDWSPSGNLIVFSRHRSASVPGSIWVIRVDGSGLRQIKVKGLGCGASVGCHEPRWSPDGKKIVFAENSGGTETTIYTINANGTALKRVTSGDDPRWGTHPLSR